MSEIESKEEARKMVLAEELNPEGEISYWSILYWCQVRSHDLGQDERDIPQSRGDQRKISVRPNFACSPCAFAATTCASMIPLSLTQPPSNDSLISANFISVPSAKKALLHSFAAFHLANFYSLVKTLNCVFSSYEGLWVHHHCPTSHPQGTKHRLI